MRTKGACTYDVRSGWAEEGTPKADESTDRLHECDSHKEGDGVKKSENFADVISTYPQAHLIPEVSSPLFSCPLSSGMHTRYLKDVYQYLRQSARDEICISE